MGRGIYKGYFFLYTGNSGFLCKVLIYNNKQYLYNKDMDKNLD